MNSLTLSYIFSLVSKISNKSCESIAKEFNCSGDTILNFLKKFDNFDEIFKEINKEIFKNKDKLLIIIDGCNMKKTHASYIEGLSDIYNHATKAYGNNIVTEIGSITDGKYLLPYALELWTKKEFNPENHKTKHDLAIKLITKIKEEINSSKVVMDGFYATKKVLNFLIENNFLFDIKFPSNRKVRINKDDEKTISVKELFREIPKNKKRLKVTKRLHWNDLLVNITCSYRKEKDLWQRIFIVSNYKENDSKVHIKNYSKRWKCEILHRTLKQHFGIEKCQARKINAQISHFKLCFFGYSLVELNRKFYKKRNQESILNKLKSKSKEYFYKLLVAPHQQIAKFFLRF
jgi:Transposase DDE domain